MVRTVFEELTTTLFTTNLQTESPSWYCARTKPKHEHIAAANVCKNLKLKVFNPRLRIQRATVRGIVRSVEPLFPCYIFIYCVIEEKLNEIQHANGVSSLVRFGQKFPKVDEAIVEDLKKFFPDEETLTIEDHLAPNDEVIVAHGAFAGMPAKVLRVMPATQRVQILLEVLGGPTSVEVDRASVVLEKNTVADRAPFLAAPSRQKARV